MSKLREIVKEREARRAAAIVKEREARCAAAGSQRITHDLATEQQITKGIHRLFEFIWRSV